VENRPDVTIEYKKKKTYVLINETVPADKNITQKEAEKKLNT
jgi:hypothetical protein